MSRRGAVKINPVTGKMEKMTEEEVGVRDGCMKLDEKYINAAKDLGLGGGDGMYSHIKSLVKVGGGDVPVGASIETEASARARATAAAKPKAAVDVTNTEAVKDAIKTHVTTVGKARIAGFGPTTTAAGSGVHGHADAFQRRKGVVNTLGGAKDVSRLSKEEPARLAPRGDAMPGARLMDVGGLDSHAAEGKAKRAAAESKMRASSSSATGRPRVGGGAQIAGFTKTGGVAMISKPAGSVTGGSGGGVAAARMRDAAAGATGGAGTGGGAAAAAAGTSARGGGGGIAAHHPGLVGGGGMLGSASSGGAATVAAGGSGTAAAPRAASAGGDGTTAGMTDAERRAAFFKKQMADKAAKTASAAEYLRA